MRRCWLWLLLLCVLPQLPALAQTGQRVALVIGNGAYRGAAPALPNPDHDARAFATAAQRSGYRTILLLDASKSEIRRTLAAFGTAAQGADLAMIYFSGHGVEIGGRNYVLPVDIQPRSGMTPNAFEQQLIGLDELDATAGRAAVSLIILDACRNDPFSPANEPAMASRGLASLPASQAGLGRSAVPTRSVVLYATSPGQVALDGAGAFSPFTTALLQFLNARGRTLSSAFEQIRQAVADATSGTQRPVASVDHLPDLALSQGSGQAPTTLLRIPTAALPTPAALQPSFLAGLPVTEEPEAIPRNFFCRAVASRGWTRGAGTGTIQVPRDGLPCAVQIFGFPEERIPAIDLVVAAAPAHGRVIIRGNSFAYLPEPGYVGQDAFSINALGVGHGRTVPMHGDVSVTVGQ